MQLHTDELDSEFCRLESVQLVTLLTRTQLAEYIAVNSLKHPIVLGKRSSGQSELLMAEQLAHCAGDHTQFLKLLHTQAVEKNIPLEEAPRSKVS